MYHPAPTQLGSFSGHPAELPHHHPHHPHHLAQLLHNPAFAPAPAGPPPLAHSHSWSLPSGYGAAAGSGGGGGRLSGHTSGHASPPYPHHPQQQPQQQQRHAHHGVPSHLYAPHAAPHLASRPRSVSMGGSRRSSFSSLDFHHAMAASAAGPGPPPHQPPQQQHLHLSSSGSAAAAAAAAAAHYAWQQPALPPSDKIAALSPGAAEILWALGLGSRVVAVSEGCDYPLEALQRAKALRRGGSGGSAADSRGLLAPARSSSAESLALAAAGAASGAGSEHHFRQHPRAPSSERSVCACGAGAGRPGAGWFVDEEVLARERPGLIVYEEELEEEQRQHEAVPGLPRRSDSAWHDREGAAGSPLAAAGEDGMGGGSAAAAAALGDGAGQGMGRVGQAVLNALVAVGLQQSCRVVCLRRRTLAEVLDSMLAVSAGRWAWVGGRERVQGPAEGSPPSRLGPLAGFHAGRTPS